MTGALNGIVAALLANGTIAAACGARVCLLVASEQDPIPYLVVRPAPGGRIVHCLDGDAVVERTMQIYTVGNSATQATALADAVRAALDQKTLNFSPSIFISCLRAADDTPTKVSLTGKQAVGAQVMCQYDVVFMDVPVS